jgi:hypothetical protein
LKNPKKYIRPLNKIGENIIDEMIFNNDSMIKDYGNHKEKGD